VKKTCTRRSSKKSLCEGCLAIGKDGQRKGERLSFWKICEGIEKGGWVGKKGKGAKKDSLEKEKNTGKREKGRSSVEQGTLLPQEKRFSSSSGASTGGFISKKEKQNNEKGPRRRLLKRGEEKGEVVKKKKKKKTQKNPDYRGGKNRMRDSRKTSLGTRKGGAERRTNKQRKKSRKKLPSFSGKEEPKINKKRNANSLSSLKRRKDLKKREPQSSILKEKKET